MMMWSGLKLDHPMTKAHAVHVVVPLKPPLLWICWDEKWLSKMHRKCLWTPHKSNAIEKGHQMRSAVSLKLPLIWMCWDEKWLSKMHRKCLNTSHKTTSYPSWLSQRPQEAVLWSWEDRRAGRQKFCHLQHFLQFLAQDKSIIVKAGVS